MSAPNRSQPNRGRTMSASTATSGNTNLDRAPSPSVRSIVHRTHGRTHGPITRLVSPSDLGEVMKPFVFLDLVRFDPRATPTPMEYLWHPHSGIATITVPLDGAVRIADTTGSDVVLPAGGVEWM